MAKYQDNQGNVIEVGNPELNPQLTQGRSLVPESTPLGKINSTSLSQTQDTNFQTQPTSIPYDISTLGAFSPMQATQQETQVSNTNRQTQGLNQQLAGQSQFRAEQELQAGLPELNNAQREYTNQLKELQAQSRSYIESLRGQGRGIDQTILSRQANEIQRQFSNRALSVAALIDATNGQLASAQEKVDRAVAQKYDPIKEQIAINTANLDLILKDPTTSLQDKNRAEQQKLINEQRARVVAKQEEDEKSKRDFTIKLLANNPNLDPLDIKALEASKSYEEAVRVANTLGLKTEKADLQFVSGTENQQSGYFDKNTGIFTPIGGGGGGGISAGNTTTAVLNGIPTQVNSDALSYAQQYASTGKLPSPQELKYSRLTASQVTEMAKRLPKPNGSLIDNNTGVKPSTLSADQEKGITALSEIVTQTLPNLIDKFNKINTGVIGGTLGTLWTSQDRQDYLTARQEFLSKLLVARSGAAVTEQEYERYSKLLPTTFNQSFFLGSDGEKKLKSLSKSMQTNLDTINSTQQVSIVGYTDVKEQLKQLSPEQKAELDKSGLLPDWAKI